MHAYKSQIISQHIRMACMRLCKQINPMHAVIYACYKALYHFESLVPDDRSDIGAHSLLPNMHAYIIINHCIRTNFCGCKFHGLFKFSRISNFKD